MDLGRVFFWGGWSPDSAIIRHHQILTLAGSDVVPLDFLFRKFGILGKAAARPQIALGFGLAWGFEPSCSGKEHPIGRKLLRFGGPGCVVVWP